MPFLLLAHPAFASVDGAEAHGDSTSMVLTLILMIAIAYLLAHLILERIQQRFLVVTGLEYVLLGAVLGPTVFPQFTILHDLDRLAPLIAFATGWVGLLYGVQLKTFGGLRSDPLALRMGMMHAVVVGAGVALLFFGFVESGYWYEPMPFHEAWIAAGTVGCASAAMTDTASRILRNRHPHLASSKVLSLIRNTSEVTSVLAILGSGVLFCIHHEGVTLGIQPGASDWVLLTCGIGITLGLLFSFYLGSEDNTNQRFLVLTGILIFAAGASFFLNLSALAVNLLLGVILVNSKQGAHISKTLESTRKPTMLMLLVFAGALWRPIDPLLGVTALTALVVCRRLLLELAARMSAAGTPVLNDIGRGLVGQGDAALAIAIATRLVFDGPLIDLAYTLIVGSVVLFEAIGPRNLQRLLADAGELDDDHSSRSLPHTATEGG
jgi:hypothetical protein